MHRLRNVWGRAHKAGSATRSVSPFLIRLAGARVEVSDARHAVCDAGVPAYGMETGYDCTSHGYQAAAWGAGYVAVMVLTRDTDHPAPVCIPILDGWE